MIHSHIGQLVTLFFIYFNFQVCREKSMRQLFFCLDNLILSYILLIREAKTLDPFLRKLRGCRSVKFGRVVVYMNKKCRMLIFKKNNV